jgi:hypothetical protein
VCPNTSDTAWCRAAAMVRIRCMWHALCLMAVAWVTPVAWAEQLVSVPPRDNSVLLRTNGGGRLTRTRYAAQDDFDHDRFLVSVQVAQAASTPTANISFQFSYRPEPDDTTLQPLPRFTQKPTDPPCGRRPQARVAHATNLSRWRPAGRRWWRSTHD